MWMRNLTEEQSNSEDERGEVGKIRGGKIMINKKQENNNMKIKGKRGRELKSVTQDKKGSI